MLGQTNTNEARITKKGTRMAKDGEDSHGFRRVLVVRDSGAGEGLGGGA